MESKETRKIVAAILAAQAVAARGINISEEKYVESYNKIHRILEEQDGERGRQNLLNMVERMENQ